MGLLYYRSKVNILTGWIHHTVYVFIVEYAIRKKWSYIFCLCAVMEVSSSSHVTVSSALTAYTCRSQRSYWPVQASAPVSAPMLSLRLRSSSRASFSTPHLGCPSSHGVHKSQMARLVQGSLWRAYSHCTCFGSQGASRTSSSRVRVNRKRESPSSLPTPTKHMVSQTTPPFSRTSSPSDGLRARTLAICKSTRLHPYIHPLIRLLSPTYRYPNCCSAALGSVQFIPRRKEDWRDAPQITCRVASKGVCV